jgi:hypothetical protein
MRTALTIWCGLCFVCLFWLGFEQEKQHPIPKPIARITFDTIIKPNMRTVGAPQIIVISDSSVWVGRSGSMRKVNAYEALKFLTDSMNFHSIHDCKKYSSFQ